MPIDPVDVESQNFDVMALDVKRKIHPLGTMNIILQTKQKKPPKC